MHAEADIVGQIHDAAIEGFMGTLAVLAFFTADSGEKFSVGIAQIAQNPIHDVLIAIHIGLRRLGFIAIEDFDGARLLHEGGFAIRIVDATKGNRILQDPEHGSAREIGAEAFGKFFKATQYAERLTVSLEAAGITHAKIQRDLPAMTERGMPKVMRETDRLNHIGIGKVRNCGVRRQGIFKPLDYAASDLSHLKRMSQARTIKITIAQVQNLGFSLKPSK
jgi:hypothetical protein